MLKALRRRLVAAPAFQRAVSGAVTGYLRGVMATSRFVIEPHDVYDVIEQPVILAMWHGQHFLVPFARRPQDRAKVLISRHRDGEINAIVAERLGLGTIRGSGAPGGDFDRKGGVGAFRAMLDALEDGYNVALTADVPKVARVTGMGIVKLAQLSGRAVVPVAIASSRRIVLRNWDRSTVNLPFSRIHAVAGPSLRVPRDAGEAELEAARRMIEQELNRATDRAHALADGRDAAEA